MKILVAGAEGQVAKSLLKAGVAHGYSVVALGRPVLDITRVNTIDVAIRAHNPDLIVNAAAYTAVDKAESEPEMAHLVNAEGAGHVARAACDASIPVIHISTDYVFDGSKTDAYVEADPTRPVSVYGRTKLLGEHAVAAANPRHLILRTAWVHSPFSHNFVKTMLRLAQTRDELKVVDDQKGSPTYALHLADAILEIAKKAVQRSAEDPIWGLYHVSGQGWTTWCGLAREVFRFSEAVGGPSAFVNPIETSAYPTPAHRPANSRLSTDKLRHLLGVELPEWRQGVAACVSQLVRNEPRRTMAKGQSA